MGHGIHCCWAASSLKTIISTKRLRYNLSHFCCQDKSTSPLDQGSLEARLTGYTVTSQIRGGPTRNAKDLLPIKLVLDRCPQVRTFLGSTRWTFPGCLLWIFNVMALWLLCPASEAMLNHMKPQVNYIFYFTDILCILVCFTHT